MTNLSWIVDIFRMTDEVWRRHANPWSVWTRFAAIPAMILAIWSRVWLGWWALVPVALVVVWLAVNPLIFPPVAASRGWAAKGIYGEKLWLLDRSHVPPGHRTVLRRLILLGIAGFVLLAWGLIRLEVWPTVFGAILVIVAQLWRIDRMGLLYDESRRT
jgi:hypothetical protein